MKIGCLGVPLAILFVLLWVKILFSMLESRSGIVLHKLRYGDDGVIVDVYTRLRGTLSFVMRIPRGRRRGIPLLMMQPLNIVDLAYDYRVGHQLLRIRDVHQGMPYGSIPYDHVKGSLVLFLSDFLYHALRSEAQNESLFDFVCSCLWRLDGCDGGLANFHIVMLVRMTKYLGICPNVGRKVKVGHAFDMQESELVEVGKGSAHCLTEEETSFLSKLLRVSMDNMHLLKLTREQRWRVLEMVEMYYRLHVPEFPCLKSLDVMKELFS